PALGRANQRLGAAPVVPGGLAARALDAGLRPQTPDPRTRLLGIVSAAGALAAAALGLRVGSAGSGGEIIPTLAVSVAAAAACGSSSALGALVLGRAAALLGASRVERKKELASASESKARQLEAAQRAHFAGDDIRAEVAQAEAALDRLRAA